VLTLLEFLKDGNCFIAREKAFLLYDIVDRGITGVQKDIEKKPEEKKVEEVKVEK
jgi:hypothetical protein